MARRTIHDKPMEDLPGAAPADAAMAEFARRLQAAMVEKGWNQAETARRASKFMPKGVKMSRDTISKYVNAITLPGPDRLAALAKALGREPSDLLSTRGVTAGGDRVPAKDVRDVGDGRAWLRINQMVPWTKALAVLAILEKED